MSMIAFWALFKDIAHQETRSITVKRNRQGIPDGRYALLEAYCPDPTCDCQRGMLNVVSNTEERQVATISYGFDRNAEDAGPFLDPFNPQSPYAPALLELIEEYLAFDSAYVSRLKKHYAMVKAAAADPTHPAQEVLRKWGEAPLASMDEGILMKKKRKRGRRRRKNPK